MQLRRLTSPMICSRQGGDQDSWSCVSSPKTNRCEIQELLMFQFKLKGKKRMMAQLKALREKFALNLQRGKPFFFFFLFRLSMDWTLSTHIRDGNLLYSDVLFNVHLYPNSGVSFQVLLQMYIHLSFKISFRAGHTGEK